MVATECAFAEVECHPNMKDGFIFVVPYSVEFSAETSEMTPGPPELSATLKSMWSVKNFALNKMTSVFVPGSAAGRWFGSKHSTSCCSPLAATSGSVYFGPARQSNGGCSAPYEWAHLFHT